MRAFALNDPDHPLLAQAALCCECGICELYACPMGLSPRLVNAHLRNEFRRRGMKTPEFESEGIHSEDNVRRLPTDRIVMRTGLTEWYANTDFAECEYHDVKEVTILTRQGVGQPAIPVVKSGDQVRQGELIADLPDNTLGARMHASINGIVRNVTDNAICIQAEK